MYSSQCSLAISLPLSLRFPLTTSLFPFSFVNSLSPSQLRFLPQFPYKPHSLPFSFSHPLSPYNLHKFLPLSLILLQLTLSLILSHFPISLTLSLLPLPFSQVSLPHTLLILSPLSPSLSLFLILSLPLSPGEAARRVHTSSCDIQTGLFSSSILKFVLVFTPL